jgi:signal transduction histidine kinase
LAASDTIPYAAAGDPQRDLYCVQFHPEVVHTEHGMRMLENFTRKICGMSERWSASAFVDDAIATIAGSVERMKSVMEQLRRGQSDKSIKRRELRLLASSAVERCVHRQPHPELIVSEKGLKVSAEPQEFITVLANLIKNAQEAATVDGSVRVIVGKDGSCGVIQVEDDGAGMSEEFIRKRLFRPFDSTKGNQGMGIGVYQAREYARRMGGELGVESTVGAGTKMTMSIPLIGDDR